MDTGGMVLDLPNQQSKKYKVLAVFLARGGSKRIKNKNIVNFNGIIGLPLNIVNFNGRPIIYNGLNVAKKSGLFTKIFVSTDSLKIKKIVEKFGIKIDKLRKKKLSGDNVPTFTILKSIIEDYQEKNIYFDFIFNIFPASPLLEVKDLRNAYKIFIKKKMIKPLLVFSKFHTPPEWAFEIKKNKIAYPINPKKILKNSKKFKIKYFESGPFSIYPTKFFKNNNYNVKKGFISYEISNLKAVDIDEPKDLDFAKALFLAKKYNK